MVAQAERVYLAAYPQVPTTVPSKQPKVTHYLIGATQHMLFVVVEILGSRCRDFGESRHDLDRRDRPVNAERPGGGANRPTN